ncbi:hypothetical protein ACFQ0B_39175 [Nonomuraea thailandensis]
MSDAEQYPLEPGPAETRAMGESVLALVQRFLEELPELPAFDLDGAAPWPRRCASRRPSTAARYPPCCPRWRPRPAAAPSAPGPAISRTCRAAACTRPRSPTSWPPR